MPGWGDPDVEVLGDAVIVNGTPAAPHSEAHPGIMHRYLRDLVYGALDGIITTFAVVAGVAGASLSARIVLILGVANLVADGISMGASNYLGIRSERAARDSRRMPGDAEAADETRPLHHGIATFLAFIVAGVIPLVAYLAPVASADRFMWALVLTLLALFVVGAARSVVTRQHWWTSGLEMLVIGAMAAAVAYGAGRVIAGMTGGSALPLD